MAKCRLILNILNLFQILFHFVFFFKFIALLRFSLVDTTKTNRKLYSCKRKKVLKVHCSWQNGQNVNFPLIQNLAVIAPQRHIKGSHSTFTKNELENRFLNVNGFDFHLSTFSGVIGTLPLIPHHTSPRVGV